MYLIFNNGNPVLAVTTEDKMWLDWKIIYATPITLISPMSQFTSEGLPLLCFIK